MMRLFGYLGAKRSDQILVPGVPGYKPYNLYAFRGANPALAKKIDPALAGQTAVIFHSTSSLAVNISQVAAFNLSKIGMKTTDKPVPGLDLLQDARHEGNATSTSPVPVGVRTTSTRSTTSTSTWTAARSRIRTTSTSRT